MNINEIISVIKKDEISKDDLIQWLEVLSINEEINNRREFIKILNSKKIEILFDNNNLSIGFSIESSNKTFIDFESIDKIKSYSFDEYFNFKNHIKFCDGK